MVLVQAYVPDGTFTTTVELVLFGAGSAARKSAWLVVLALQTAVVQDPVCADAMKGKNNVEDRSRVPTIVA